MPGFFLFQRAACFTKSYKRPPHEAAFVIRLSGRSRYTPEDDYAHCNRGTSREYFFLVAAIASTVDASLIPDGTYVVKVERIQHSAHALVVMNNVLETTLTATGSVSFGKVKANETIRVSIVKGKVPVMAVQ